jgi:hypothetical protein
MKLTKIILVLLLLAGSITGCTASASVGVHPHDDDFKANVRANTSSQSASTLDHSGAGYTTLK